MAFESIISGELARQAQGSRDIQNIFAQFGAGIEQGRQQRAQQEAGMQIAEQEIAAMSKIDPSIAEQFMSVAETGKPQDIINFANAAKAGLALTQQQEQADLRNQLLTGQIAQTGAQTGLTGAQTGLTEAQTKDIPLKRATEQQKAANAQRELDLRIQSLQGKSRDEKLKSERDLRNDFNKLAPIKNLRLAQTGAKKVSAIGDKVRKALKLPEGTELTNEQFEQALTANPNLVSAADDLSMVFNFMKTLDPNSVVRESEFKSAADAKAWVDKNEDLANQPVVKAIFARVLTGQRLLPAQKAEMIRSAKLNLDQQIKAASPTIRQYRNIEERGEFDKGFIVQDELAALLPSGEVVEETQTTAVAPSEPIEISDRSELPAIIQSSQPGQVIFLNGKPIGTVPRR